jgi:hypothetical protein
MITLDPRGLLAYTQGFVSLKTQPLGDDHRPNRHHRRPIDNAGLVAEHILIEHFIKIKASNVFLKAIR